LSNTGFAKLKSTHCLITVCMLLEHVYKHLFVKIKLDTQHQKCNNSRLYWTEETPRRHIGTYSAQD